MILLFLAVILAAIAFHHPALLFLLIPLTALRVIRRRRWAHARGGHCHGYSRQAPLQL